MDAIEQKIEEYTKVIYWAINNLKYLPESIDKEDLVQVGRIALWEAIDSYDEDSSHTLYTQCYKRVYSRLIDYLRSSKAKKRTLELNYHTELDYCIDEEINDSLLVYEMSKHLSTEDFEMFIDKHLRGYTYLEISDKYNVTVSIARTRLDNAKKTLKNNLQWGDEQHG